MCLVKSSFSHACFSRRERVTFVHNALSTLVKMVDIEQLDRPSLVSRVCTEVENHININDKDLAEFIIALTSKHARLEKFKKVLARNGAKFSDSFTSNLHRIIRDMSGGRGKEKAKKTKAGEPEPERSGRVLDENLEKKKKQFPGLCIPDDHDRVQ